MRSLTPRSGRAERVSMPGARERRRTQKGRHVVVVLVRRPHLGERRFRPHDARDAGGDPPWLRRLQDPPSAGKDLGDQVELGDEFTHQYRARKHRYMNPPTQEMFEGMGYGQDDQTG